jgi:long-chain acyl-CoA synthetase
MSTLTARFFEQAARYGDKTCFASRDADGWTKISWTTASQRVHSAMIGLRRAGIEPGDRVMILAENCPEWAIYDLAVMGIGALVVPAYVTHTTTDLSHIFNLVTPKALIASSQELTDRAMSAGLDASSLTHVWSRTPDDLISPLTKNITLLPWTDLLDNDTTQGEELHPAAISDTCCLIFTSGTSGLAKAAELSHRSIGANVDAAVAILNRFNFGENDRFLSFLPLAHAYEHTAGLHMPISLGSEIWFCESPEKLQQYLPEVRPTVATAVPRLYDLLYGRINGQLKNASPIKQWMFNETLSLGKKRIAKKSLSLGESLLDRVLDQLVRKKVRARFGGRIRYFISGGAALNPVVGEFFTALGVGIIQGYGQTEASPLISVNRPDCIKLDSVGRTFDGVDIKLADDGELLVRGDLIMNGYWEDPKATAGTIIDGWLHTGDLASIDSDQFIRIIGRKKDLIVTSGGENIAPSKIESMLSSEPEIEQAVVFGDGKPWLGAVLIPTEETKLAPNCAALLSSAVQKVNEQLNQSERVRKYVTQEMICSTDNGLLTPTQKVKRDAVLSRNETEIQALY